MDSLKRVQNVVSVYKEFSYQTKHPLHTAPDRKRVRVDIVTDHGLHWLRLKASRKTCHEDFFDSDDDEDDNEEEGDGEEGSDGGDDDIGNKSKDTSNQMENWQNLPSSIRIAKGLCQAAEQNPIFYQRPQVHLWFTGLIDIDGEKVCSLYQGLGCHAQVGSAQELCDQFVEKFNSGQPLAFLNLPGVDPSFPFLEILNVDVSSMIAIITDLCHRPHQLLSEESQRVPAIIQQWTDEREDPLLPRLFELFDISKRIVMPETAFRIFETIVTTLAGRAEFQRARALFREGQLANPENPDTLEVDGSAKLSGAIKLPGSANLPGSTKLSEMVDWDRIRGKVEVVPDKLSDRFQQLQQRLEDADRDQKEADKEEISVSHHQRSKQLRLARHRLKVVLPKFNDQHLAVLGTGDSFKATSITSNRWITKALSHMDDAAHFPEKYGDISVWTHASRSLLERRQDGTWQSRREQYQLPLHGGL